MGFGVMFWGHGFWGHRLLEKCRGNPDKEKAYDIIEVMEGIGSNHGVSVAQIALAWLLHQEVVTSVIIGAKDKNQLEDNLHSVNIQFKDEDLQKLDEVSQLAPEYPGWMVSFMQRDRNPNQQEDATAKEEA